MVVGDLSQRDNETLAYAGCRLLQRYPSVRGSGWLQNSVARVKRNNPLGFEAPDTTLEANAFTMERQISLEPKEASVCGTTLLEP